MPGQGGFEVGDLAVASGDDAHGRGGGRDCGRGCRRRLIAHPTTPASRLSAHLCVFDVYDRCMSRTNIDIDDELIAQVMRRYGVATKKQAVDLALRRLVGVPLSREFLLSLEGIGWDADLDDIRRERPSEF